jgi:hypothetical protein
MVALTSVIERYQSTFNGTHAIRLIAHQRRAPNAIRACRTGHYGHVHWQCTTCDAEQRAAHSCGHRNGHQCQNHETTRWLQRQSAKLLPVEYFLVTFTLPGELRSLSWDHPDLVYSAMFQCAHSTLQLFAVNHPTMGSELGLCAVLHTHSRRLDYHPRVHIVVPAGALGRQRKQWKKHRGKYLFNAFALASVGGTCASIRKVIRPLAEHREDQGRSLLCALDGAGEALAKILPQRVTRVVCGLGVVC